MKACLDIFKCKVCSSFSISEKCNYGYCSKLKNYVYENNTFCEANGILDPVLWFMESSILEMYLRQEIEYKIRVLPKHLDREHYKRELGIV